VVRAQCLAFFPATLLVFGTGWAWNRDETDADDRILIVAMIGWALGRSRRSALMREYLGNQFIGAMAPACVLSALVTVRLAARLRRPALVPAIIALALVAHAPTSSCWQHPSHTDAFAPGDPDFGDPTAQLGAYLASREAAERGLYVADDRTVLYVLTGASPPTRYAYPPHLLDRYQEIVAGVDGPREIARDPDQHPAYVVRDLANRRHEDPRGKALLDRALQAEYRPSIARNADRLPAHRPGLFLALAASKVAAGAPDKTSCWQR
jgi:hypothetical protein